MSILSKVHMLNSVLHLGTLGIVEAVEGADKIAGDSANAFKFNAYPYKALSVWF